MAVKRTYAGAAGRVALGDGCKLGRGWYAQPKYDGQYVNVHTDRDGKVFALTSRTGRAVESDLTGCALGIPYSELCAELTAHTEAGRRRAACDGFETAHVFDAVRLDGRLLAELPWQQRDDALRDARARAIRRDDDKPWLDDPHGNAHDIASGRFSYRIPTGWRRFPMVPHVPAAHGERMIADHVETPDAWSEGLVFVAAHARIGARRCKLKWKPVLTLDATVVDASAKTLYLDWRGCLFTVANRHAPVDVGAVVEVACEGFYESTSTPRFARLTRVRTDL